MAEKDLNIYLTGVATEGDPQTDPDASLGGKRSGTILQSLAASSPVNVTGVVIDDVPAQSGDGSSTLSFSFTGATLTYAAPGDGAGQAVDVSSDGTYELYSNDTDKYMIVTVTAASLPSSDQSDAITLTNIAEGLFDSVSSTEAAAGDTEYRAVMLKNDSGYTMYSAKVWIETNTPFSDDSVEIAIEAPSGGEIQSVADESTAPTGVTFYTAAGEGNALSIGDLAPGSVYGVWVKRVVTATGSRYADNYFTLSFKADTA
jgi:hypothetical protein